MTEMTEERADKEVSAWWNTIKDNACWSGAIVGLSWIDLWAEIKTELRGIYAARMTEERAREILGEWLSTDDYIDSPGRYSWLADDEPKYLFVDRRVALTADELEAIAFWMRAHAT